MRAVILLACAVFYLVLAWPALHKPLISDEAAGFALDAAQPHYGLISIWHPPLCFDLLRGLCHLGLRDQGLRLLGVVGVVVSFLLIERLCRRIAQEEHTPDTTVWAWVFFATNPLLIQGSTLLDIDTTVLMPLMLLWLAVFSAGSGRPTLAWLLRCAAVLWLNLWAKLSTPLAFPIVAAVWYGLQHRWREALRVVGFISLLAAGAFLVAWGVYAKAIGQPFASVFGRATDVLTIAPHFPGVWLSPIGELANRTMRLVLWLGPFLCLLCGLALWKRAARWTAGRPLGTLDLCWLVTLPIVVGYLLLGHHGGFPKYHFPLVAPFAIGLASFVVRADRVPWFQLGLLAVSGTVFMGWVGLDPLYLWNYQLRLAVILAPEQVSHCFWQLAGVLGLYALVFAVAVVLQMKRPLAQRLLPAALTGLLVWNVSVAWLQWRAPYSTTFLYGRDTTQMVRLAERLKGLAAARPGSDIVAPEDVLYLAGLPFSRHRATDLWHREGFLRVLTDPNVSTVVTSPEWYSISFYRRVLPDPDVARLLKEHFRPVPFGLETIWMRQGVGP